MSEEKKDKEEKTDKSRKINVEDADTSVNKNTETDDPKADAANAEAKDAVKADAQEDKAEPTDDELAKAQKQVDELKDQLLRKVAEFDNYRKRTLKEKAELILNGGEKTITAILPVLDDFERALANNTDDPKAIKEGMKLIFKKFQKVLAGLGVKKIDTDGKDFDVDYHEAVAMVPGQPDEKKGKVIDCIQTGYTLNDKVIRHAKVAVGQ